MRGLVLGFDKSIGTGLMRGDDGKRYVFAIDDWLSKPRPRAGQMVDFELHKGVAMEVFLIKNAAGFDASTGVEAIQSLFQQLSLLARDVRISSRLVMPLAVLIAFCLPVLASGGREFSGYNIVGFLRQIMQTASSMSSLGSEETRSVMHAARSSLYLYLGLYILPVYAAYLLMQLGAKVEKRTSGLVLPALCVGLPVLLPPLVLALFYALSPAGASSLKLSILSSLSIALPDAYLIFGQGVVILLAIGVLGLVYGLRKPNPKKAFSKKSEKKNDSALPSPQTANQDQPKTPVQPAQSHPSLQARQEPMQKPRPQPQRPPQQPQQRPAAPAQSMLQDTPQNNGQQLAQNPPKQQPNAPKPVANQSAIRTQAVEPQAVEDDISEILRQIRSENSN